VKVNLLILTVLGLVAYVSGQSHHDSARGAPFPQTGAVHDIATCWLNAAFEHQKQSYGELLMTRGLPPPPEEQLSTALANDFPPGTLVLLYDYVAPWHNSQSYESGQMVLYAGGMYKRSAASSSDTGERPANNKEQWELIQSCEPNFNASDKQVLRAWLVSREGIEAYAALPFSPESLNAATRDLDRSLSLSFEGNRNAARGFDLPAEPGQGIAFESALDHLSNLLIPKTFWPVMKRFGDLIVVPQLAIAEVPFSLLRGPDGSPLVDTTAVWIGRNSTDLAGGEDTLRVNSGEWNAKAKYTFNAPLVVGNPAFHNTGSLYLPQLPGAEQEARAVASIMHTAPLIGDEAGKAEVESRAGSAGEIYIATHGAAMPNDPLSGFLALAGAPDESGRWTAKEIQSRDLSKTDLAVLSACQTGLGGVHAAGVIGVGRAFTLAGVRWVVMSLWNIDDKATSELMQAFVSNLAGCETVHACVPAQALRKAMLAERNSNSDPKSWGSFVVFGVPNGKRIHR